MSKPVLPSITLLLLVFVIGHLTGSNKCSVSLYYEKVLLPATTARSQQFRVAPPSFTDLVNASGSDKYFLHHYEHYYTDWLEPYRRTSGLTFLEIGVLHGESLKMWDSYFLGETKKIYGLAYGQYDFESKTNFTGNTQVLKGDQSKNETMQLVKTKGPFDVIIDDGSHIPQHQVFTFFHLWNSIKPGGTYIVEDLEVNYWNPRSMPRLYGYELNNTGFDVGPHYSAVDKFKQFIDILPRNQLGKPDISIMEGDETICGMDFGKNIMRFRKCSDHEMTMAPAVKKDHTYTGPRIIKNFRYAAMESNPEGFREDHHRVKRVQEAKKAAP